MSGKAATCDTPWRGLPTDLDQQRQRAEHHPGEAMALVEVGVSSGGRVWRRRHGSGRFGNGMKKTPCLISIAGNGRRNAYDTRLLQP